MGEGGEGKEEETLREGRGDVEVREGKGRGRTDRQTHWGRKGEEVGQSGGEREREDKG